MKNTIKLTILLTVLFIVGLMVLSGYGQIQQSPTQENIIDEELAQLDDISKFPTSMSFFITSTGPGNGANLGGLSGADAHCQKLAESVSSNGQIWKAYLSTTDVNARDRIGNGPWYNFEGVKIAENIENLHGDNNLNKETALSENGEIINGREDSPNRHDIMTGSQLDGTAFSGDEDTTCQDWTGSGEGSARVGHHDRTGGGDYPESWNSAHGSKGCSQENLQGTGGDGLFYCFSIDES